MADGGKLLNLTIVTPHGNKKELQISHIRAPGKEGEFGVLYGHLPFITTLQVGPVYLDTAQGKQVWATSGGYIEVLPDQVTILAETAEESGRIDIERAEAARQRALGHLKDKSTDLDFERAKLALVKAINRIKIGGISPGG